MTTTSIPTTAELIQLVDEQLASDETMLAGLARQADEIHAAYGDLLARLRSEAGADETLIPGARRLRG